VLRTCAPLALLLTARALLAAEPTLPEYVPPSTKILIGIEVRTIVDSEIGKSIIEQLKSASGDSWAKGMPKGFDPARDVDEIWIATSSVDKNGPTLAIARGHFDRSRLPAAIGSYHQVPLIPMDAKREQLLALIDGQTILAGDRFNVERAIDRRGSKQAPDATLAAAAAEMRTRYWIWGVADHLETLTPAAAKNTPQAMQNVDGFEFGLAMIHDLEIAAQVRMHSAEEAQKLFATMGLLQAMSRNPQPNSIQPKIESRINGKTLNISVRITEEELKQVWEQQRAAITQGLAQLPQQIASAKSGRGFDFTAAPKLTPPPPRENVRNIPVSKESKIVSDPDGNTVTLTLPGMR